MRWSLNVIRSFVPNKINVLDERFFLEPNSWQRYMEHTGLMLAIQSHFEQDKNCLHFLDGEICRNVNKSTNIFFSKLLFEVNVYVKGARSRSLIRENKTKGCKNVTWHHIIPCQILVFRKWLYHPVLNLPGASIHALMCRKSFHIGNIVSMLPLLLFVTRS